MFHNYIFYLIRSQRILVFKEIFLKNDEITKEKVIHRVYKLVIVMLFNGMASK